MFYEHEEIARQIVAERTRNSTTRTGARVPQRGARHRIATTLHRLADRVEPASHRTALTLGAR
jgi:hypothetical protein